MNFTEPVIKEIFGPEAAEDEQIERLKSYYFKGDIYEQFHNDLPLRILVGHKGIGKSAAFKISYSENLEKNRVAVWIKPDDIMEICQDNKNLLQMIRDWKIGLTQVIYEKVLDSVGIADDGHTNNMINLSVKLIKEVSLVFHDRISSEGVDTRDIKKNVISQYLKNKNIYVYIDDLDRGWRGTDDGVARISALLNAARDLTNDNPGLCIRISLRSDVYFLVRTSDESTDKIENSVIWYSWTQHQILCMLAKRINLYNKKKVSDRELIKMPQFKIAQFFNPIFEYIFHGYGKWENVPTYKVLASMIRRRPRDLVKLCTLAARTAYENGHDLITTDDWLDNFDYYSQERLQDTVNEYRSELPDIERLLLGMKPSNRQRHCSGEFIYSTEQLISKIKNISSTQPFVFSKGSQATPQELAAFLYKINFLVARKDREHSDEIDRRYFEDHKYLSNRFMDFGYKWEVHPAFRWALYPDAGKDIFKAVDVDAEI